MKELLLQSITLLHTLLVLFVVLAPFISSNYLLMLHFITIPFLIIHWLFNDNTCILTIIERNMRKQIYKEHYNDDDCFTCKLIEPIYDFKSNYDKFSKIIYFVTIILWLVSASRLLYKYQTGNISSWKELFKL